VYFGGGRKASFYGILRDRWKNLSRSFGLSKHLKKTLEMSIVRPGLLCSWRLRWRTFCWSLV